MAKQRLTITLDKKLLSKIDNLIDGASIRNRSHAIEYFLRQSVLPKQTKVLILAGGEGVKFRPLTNELPKSLLPISGKPLLSYTLEALSDQGFKEIYISIGHLGDKIEDYFGNGSDLGLNIQYIKQKKGKPGTARPLLQAKTKLLGDPFLMIYGDVLSSLNFSDLVEFHSNRKCLATMALTSVEKPAEWGVASVQGARVVDFIERPKTKTKSHLINAGVYVLNPETFDYIAPSDLRLEKGLFPKLARDGKLCAYPFDADWFDVSNPKVYAEVLKKKFQ
jgi:NDP-sugar pyrophosphorylase family protein